MPQITEDRERIADVLTSERGVIGAILSEPDLLQVALAELLPEHFRFPKEQQVFKAILNCVAENVPADYLNVHEKIGGRFDDVALYSEFPLVHSFDYHVQKIKSAHARRQAQAMLQDAMVVIGSTDTDLIAQFKNMSDEVIGMIVKQDGPPKRVGTDGEFQKILADMMSGVKNYYPTGIQQLDNVVGGFYPGQLWIIGGRTSMGKSSLAQQIALNLATNGVFTAYLPIEDSPKEIKERWVVMRSNVARRHIEGGMHEIENEQAIRATNALEDIPLFLIDREIEWQKIKARIEIAKFRNPLLRVVFIDYLGVIRHSRYKNRWDNIAEITADAKYLAGKLGIAVVLLCQINRQTEGRRDHKPSMGDLRDSGSVEQDADVILLIYRQSYYDKTANPTAIVSVAKQRNGPTGACELEFDKDTLRFL